MVPLVQNQQMSSHMKSLATPRWRWGVLKELEEKHRVPPGSQWGHTPRAGNHQRFLSRGFPGEGVVPIRCSDKFCLLLARGGTRAGIQRSKLRLWQMSFDRNSRSSFHLCWQKSNSSWSSAAWGRTRPASSLGTSTTMAGPRSSNHPGAGGAMQNICRQTGQSWSAKTFYFHLAALGIAAAITSPKSPSSQGEQRTGVNRP